jgi:hypothetical protein
MRRPSALVIPIAIACAPILAADRPSYSYDVVVDSPRYLEAALREALRYDRTCAAVARPVGIAQAHTIAVLLTRPEGATKAPPATAPNVRVLTVDTDRLGELAQRMDASAAQGFGLCGLTFATPAYGRPDDYDVTVVMTRTDDKPTGTSYRVINYTGRKGEWAPVMQAGADGFAVTQVAARPQPDVVSTSDMVLVAEKTATSRPLAYSTVTGGNSGGLQKDLDKAIARGDCEVKVTWVTSEWMKILLAKPLEGPCAGQHEYKVEDSSGFMGLSVRGSGTLLGLHRVKDDFMALYDRKDSSLEYTVEEGVLNDQSSSPARLPREHQWLVDKLSADGGRGYLPVDVAWRAGKAEGTRAIDVILARKRD